MKKISYKCCEDAKSATRLEPIVISILMVVVFVGVIPMIVGLMLNIFLKNVSFGDSTIGGAVLTSVGLVIIASLLLLVIFLWIKYYQGRKISTIGFYKKNFIKHYFIGAFLGIVIFSIVIGILYALGVAHINTNPTITTGRAALGAVLILIPAWILQSAAEEALTRGWLLSTIGSRYNLTLGIVVSSSLFGVLHIFNNGITVLAIVNIIIVGVMLSLVSIYYNNIWVASGIHFTWNMFQGNIYGVPVSGGAAGNVSIIQTKLSGSEILTGGAFGPESSVIATVVIGIVILFYLILLLKRTNSTEN